MHKWLRDGDSFGREYARLFNLEVDDNMAPGTVSRSRVWGGPAVEIHSARPARRRTAYGATRTDLVIEITQRRDGYFDPDEQKRADTSRARKRRRTPDFRYRAGATVLIDPASGDIRRVIRKPGSITDDEELDRVRRYLRGDFGTAGNAFDAGLVDSLRLGSREREEPFALLHQLAETQ
jgi:hypothetical protein